MMTYNGQKRSCEHIKPTWLAIMTSENDVWLQHTACYSQADELYKAGSLRKAIRIFRSALALVPNDVDTLWAIADCHSELGQAHKAEKAYRAALVRADRSERGNLLYNIANALLDQRRPTAAIILYRQVRRKSNAFYLARKNLRLARRQEKNNRFHSSRL